MYTRVKKTVKQETPFYAIPDSVRTSSQVIAEAKRSLTLRAIPIPRPDTRTDGSRHLFGPSTSKVTFAERRPPSVFSLGPGKFSEEPQYSRPNSRQRLLSPIVTEESNVPPTPVQSLVEVDSLSSPSCNEPALPVLKTSQSSPTTSSRMRPSSSGRGDRIIKHSNSSTAAVISERRDSAISNNVEYSSTNIDQQRQHGSDLAEATDQLPVNSSHSIKSSRSQTGQVWESVVRPLMEQLDPASQDSSHLCKVCSELYTVLERHGLLGKSAGAKRRSVLLKSVFAMLNHTDPLLLLRLARLILAMQVTGSNLVNVCKLVFSLSKEEKNDSLFLNEEIIVLIINVIATTDPITQYEAMVYAMGTIKLLATNTQLREALSRSECIKVLSQCIQKCSECTELSENQSNIANVLVQLVAGLRNLSDTGSVYDQFITHSIPQSLSVVLQQHQANADLVFNMSRLLSKLTLAPQCNHTIGQTTLYLSLLPSTLTTHIKNEEIVLRLCFILNNISTGSPEISQTLCDSHSLVPSLNQVLVEYYQLLSTAEQTSGSSKNKATDVLIKCVSLIANLSVHSAVAAIVISNEETILQLLHILESFTQCEELMVNSLAAFNNLSFYSQQEILNHHQDKLIEILIDNLSPDNRNVLLECIRVLGNLTRHSSIRTIVCSRRVDELLIALLDSKHIEVVYAVCGVLVNMTMEGDHIPVLKRNNGIKKLLDVLSHFGRRDWLLASLACKVIWNYSQGLANVRNSFTDEEIVTMFHLLEEYLDPVTAFTNCMLEEDYTDDNNSIDQFWTTEFVPVATNIVQKLHNTSNKLISI